MSPLPGGGGGGGNGRYVLRTTASAWRRVLPARYTLCHETAWMAEGGGAAEAAEEQDTAGNAVDRDDANPLEDIESPENFMKLLRAKQFPKKKGFVPEKEWSTRFMRLSQGNSSFSGSVIAEERVKEEKGIVFGANEGMAARNRSIFYLETMRRAGNEETSVRPTLRASMIAQYKEYVFVAGARHW